MDKMNPRHTNLCGSDSGRSNLSTFGITAAADLLRSLEAVEFRRGHESAKDNGNVVQILWCENEQQQTFRSEGRTILRIHYGGSNDGAAEELMGRAIDAVEAGWDWLEAYPSKQ